MYLFRDVGMTTSINFQIQGHILRLVDCEGSHTIQEVYESLDLHVGQSSSFLVTAHGVFEARDSFVVASMRSRSHPIGNHLVPLPGLEERSLWASSRGAHLPCPLVPEAGPDHLVEPDGQCSPPQPAGLVPLSVCVVRTIVLQNSAEGFGGKRRYSVNKMLYVNPDTPLKLADCTSLI
ncbi:SKU5 similar 15 [Striga hermonthica]|uniref:SKU5 similar 15 n=1 Tax=Striga hermonthica TaxID=68872 RepID=A0A9N7P053_STRHE|nr:SKU5 similar 15 [Striga hermonthica]